MFRKKQKQLTNKEINEILFTAYRMSFFRISQVFILKTKRI